MTVTFKESLNGLLTRLAIELDIPDHVYEDAVVKYESVGAWLDAPDSTLKQYSPEIFPQGSVFVNRKGSHLIIEKGAIVRMRIHCLLIEKGATCFESGRHWCG